MFIFIYLIVLSLSSSSQSNLKVEDPVAKIRPLNKRGSPYNHHVVHRTGIRQTTATKTLHQQDEQNNQFRQDSGSCVYKFVVPNHNDQSTTCTTSNQLHKKLLDKLQIDVSTAKTQIEEIKSEVRGDKSEQTTITNIKRNIAQLQRESRISEQRLSQLYMQLLHEIINKRDDTIERQRLEQQAMNLTVLYYKLKIEHEQLHREHVTLQEQLSNQSEELHYLRHQIRLIMKTQTGHDEMKTTTASNTLCEADKEESNRLPISNTQQTPTSQYKDCTEVQDGGHNKSNVYILKLPGYSRKVKVWCDMKQDPGGWTVIQRRSGSRKNFNRSMRAYKRGFGRVNSDYWLGLETLHRLTTQVSASYKLRIELEDWTGDRRFAEYQSFRVEEEKKGYKLKLTHFSGNAGDSLTWHNNMEFSTYNNDNIERCANRHGAGWWFRNCARANLNGKYYKGGYYSNSYQDGIYWMSWKGSTYSLKSVTMKIRRLE